MNANTQQPPVLTDIEVQAEDLIRQEELDAGNREARAQRKADVARRFREVSTSEKPDPAALAVATADYLSAHAGDETAAERKREADRLAPQLERRAEGIGRELREENVGNLAKARRIVQPLLAPHFEPQQLNAIIDRTRKVREALFSEQANAPHLNLGIEWRGGGLKDGKEMPDVPTYPPLSNFLHAIRENRRKLEAARAFGASLGK